MVNAVELLRQGRKEELWQMHCGFLDLSTEQFMTIQRRLLLEQIELLKRCELGNGVMRGAKPSTVEEFREQVPLTTYQDYCPELLEKREELVSRAFDEAQKRLEEMRGSQAYIDMLDKLIEESVSNIKEDVIVQFGSKDKFLFTSEFVSSIRTHVIKTLGKGIRVQFDCVEDNTFSGVIIKSKDGKMVVDNSFSGLFKRLKEELRGKVSEMLLQEED